MKLWIDDIREAPEGYIWCRSVNTAKIIISSYMIHLPYIEPIEVIDIDHDAGDYVTDGGDYIKLLDWLEEQDLSLPIHIHSMNPVGVANMKRIIKRNHWKEV